MPFIETEGTEGLAFCALCKKLSQVNCIVYYGLFSMRVVHSYRSACCDAVVFVDKNVITPVAHWSSLWPAVEDSRYEERMQQQWETLKTRLVEKVEQEHERIRQRRGWDSR